MSSKIPLLKAVLKELETRIGTLVSAAQETKAGANDAENKQEGKYDTRAIEAGYLAQGQAAKAAELAEAAETIRGLQLRDYGPSDTVGTGALVSVRYPGDLFRFFLLPAGGGIEIDDGDGEITVVTPEAPLGQKLLGRSVGEKFSPNPGVAPVEIVGVA